MNFLLINNHDSFTWNLVELLRTGCKCNVKIVSSEVADPEAIVDYDGVIFSPGPGLPAEQPAMFSILQKIETLFSENQVIIPVFGVCLGMQAIAYHFGGSLYNLPKVIHGQPRHLKILKTGIHLFEQVPDNTQVGLYHSWAVDKISLPESIEILAESEDGTIMAIAHKHLPICGVQFHPESIMTPDGGRMMKNWIDQVHKKNRSL